MIKYIHIGYPKTLTTTLQRCFFNHHPQIYHLGIGCGSNIDYRTRDIHRMIEPYLIYCKDFKYIENESFFQKMLIEKFEEVRQKNYRAVGISCELISISAPDHIDTTLKARRLRSLFGSDTKIIIIIREQLALLQSLYKEFIRQGYLYNYQEFINYLYTFQDRSMLYDLLFDKAYSYYVDLFGKENVIILPIEQFLSEKKELIIHNSQINLIKVLSDFLEINYVPLNIEHFNPSLSEKAVVIKQQLNNLQTHDYGNSMFRPAFTHRLLPYFEDDIRVEIPSYAIEDVKTKRKLICSSEEIVTNIKIDFSIPENLKTPLEEMFMNSNNKLRLLIAGNLDNYL